MRTLSGVVALVGDREAQRDVAAFGLLADPITDLRYGDSRGGPPKGPAPVIRPGQRAGVMASLRTTGRRRLLNRARALHRAGRLDRKLYAAGLEVVDLTVVLDERRGVIEVAGVAELDRRRALAGVVALVRDVEANSDVVALGFLFDPTLELSEGRNRYGQHQRQHRCQQNQLPQLLLLSLSISIFSDLAPMVQKRFYPRLLARKHIFLLGDLSLIAPIREVVLFRLRWRCVLPSLARRREIIRKG